jgi:hypothetical protein
MTTNTSAKHEAELGWQDSRFPFNSNTYVTHAELLGVAHRRHCYGIHLARAPVVSAREELLGFQSYCL